MNQTKRLLRWILSLIIAMSAATTVTAGEYNNPPTPNSATEATANLTLGQSELTLKQGDSQQLTATLPDVPGESFSLTWSSSDTGVATVSEDGTVCALTPGTAIITATATGDKGDTFFAECSVTVTAIATANGERFTKDGLKYKVIDIDLGTVMCTTYDGTCPENLVIPSDVYGFKVTEVGNSAFSNCSDLKSVSLPNTITRIGQYAFEKCSNLKSLVLPEGLVLLEQQAFASSGLTQVTLPSTLTTIETKAFYGTGIESIAFPPSLKKIGSRAFEISKIAEVTIPTTLEDYQGAFFNCYSLISFKIEEGVTAIPAELFYNCHNLKNGIIPSSVTSIGSSAFEGCNSIETLSIPPSVTSIGSEAFSRCTSLTSLVLPETLTTLSNSIFYNCANLTSLTIPESVTTNSAGAFSGCTSLPSLTIPTNVLSIGKDAFKDMTGAVVIKSTTPPAVNAAGVGINDSGSILVPASSLGTYQRAEGWNSSLPSLCPLEGWATENGAVINAEWYADLIYARIKAENVDGSKITSVGNDAFKDCTELAAINLDDNIARIGDRAFSGCTALTELTLPIYLKSIGENAFDGCSTLTTITLLTDTPVTIGNGAFDNTADAPITVQSSMVAGYQEDYPQYASRFGAYDKDFIAYEYYTQGSSSCARIIPAESYRTLSTLRIPNEVVKNGVTYRVEEIGDDAFSGCANLTGVVSAGATEGDIWSQRTDISKIGNRAFKGCTSLTDLPCFFDPQISGFSFLSEIGEEAFSGCTALTQIPTTGSITINDRAFSGCTGLGTVEFDNYCYLKFGNNVFDGCTGITRFVFNAMTPITISAQTFDGTDCPIYVQDAAIEAYKEAWPQYADRIVGMGKPADDIFNYSYNTDGTATITGFRSDIRTSELETLTIPATTTFDGREYSITDFNPQSSMMDPGMGLNLFNLKTLTVDAPLKSFCESYLYLRVIETLVLPSSLEVLKNIDLGWDCKLSAITLPRSLKRIESRFTYASITELTIPAKVEYITSSAFQSITTLEKIEVKAKTPPTLGGDGVFDDTNNCPIIVPYYAIDDYKTADGWSAYADRIVSNMDVPSHFPLSEEQKTMTVGGKHKLRVVEWESSDPDVVQVDEDGNLYAVSEGDALITARTLDGKLQSSCFVTVEQDPAADIHNVEIDIDSENIQAVYNLDGVQLLGAEANADDLRRLAAGIYIVRTTHRTYKLKL